MSRTYNRVKVEFLVPVGEEHHATDQIFRLVEQNDWDNVTTQISDKPEEMWVCDNCGRLMKTEAGHCLGCGVEQEDAE